MGSEYDAFDCMIYSMDSLYFLQDDFMTVIE